jgi:hypothetical protein
MEVHHHAHHDRKTWKSYIWEFLMLFLAVFCGFLAEYQLEHKIEKDRTEELAKSFYQELKNDSITAELKVKNRLKQEAALDYMINFFRDSSFDHLSKQFQINYQYGINFRTPIIFEPRTIILDQLRNSGSLRYFKNEKLQLLAGELSVAIKSILERQQLEDQSRKEHVTPIHIQLNDHTFDTEMRHRNESLIESIAVYEKSDDFFPFFIDKTEAVDRKKIIKGLYYHKTAGLMSTRRLHIRNYQQINVQLLQILRQEFNIKD